MGEEGPEGFNLAFEYQKERAVAKVQNKKEGAIWPITWGDSGHVKSKRKIIRKNASKKNPSNRFFFLHFYIHLKTNFRTVKMF